MSTASTTSARRQGRTAEDPSDRFLMSSLLGGDAAALRKLMERYDRLVRYEILRLSADRCRKDPHWLESLASTTWEGFVRALRRAPEQLPDSVAAYLVRIARNQTVSALRRGSVEGEAVGGDDELAPDVAAPLEEPKDSLARLELLEAMRACLAELDTDAKMLTTQLEAITGRRWREASAALGLSESTLRSRWRKTVERLGQCIQRKTGKSLAPEDLPGD